MNPDLAPSKGCAIFLLSSCYLDRREMGFAAPTGLRGIFLGMHGIAQPLLNRGGGCLSLDVGRWSKVEGCR
jgi:hypothetical protein